MKMNHILYDCKCKFNRKNEIQFKSRKMINVDVSFKLKDSIRNRSKCACKKNEYFSQVPLVIQ